MSTTFTQWSEKFLEGSRRNREAAAAKARRATRPRRPACEGLEGRELMAAGGVNVDYTLMGGQWDVSRPVSYSIAPDGVGWDSGATNDINAHLGAEFGSAAWQKAVAAALQTWAASANIDFTPTVDSNYAINAGGLGQDDPRFGDIRIGGSNFTSNTIALTYGPPPNGSTAAGDVNLNTDYNFGPNGQWDLQTVLTHELGHSLGLGESPQFDSVMYAYYSGVRHSLSGYDVEGIQSIYGPRVADPLQARGQATTAASAVDITGSLGADGSGQVGGLSLDAIGDSEYLAVTVPAGRGGPLMVNAVANGHSLMSPKLTVIDAATGATLAVDSHPDQYGNTASVMVPGAQAGHRYLIVVTGATQDVFSVGDYALQVALSGGVIGGTPPVTSTPVPTIPTTPVATTPTTPVATTPSKPTTPVTPPPAATPVAPVAPPVATAPVAPTAPVVAADQYSASTSFATATNLGSISGQRLVTGLTLRSGSDLRVFSFTPAAAGRVSLASANATILVGDANGNPVASGRGLISFTAPRAGARYYVVVLSPTGAAVADAGFAVQVTPLASATTNAAAVTIGQAIPAGTSHASKPVKKKHKKP